MTPEGRVFDSSLDKGYPYQVRVGAGQVSRAWAKALVKGMLRCGSVGGGQVGRPSQLACCAVAA